jgi:hypothetical protein
MCVFVSVCVCAWACMMREERCCWVKACEYVCMCMYSRSCMPRINTYTCTCIKTHIMLPKLNTTHVRTFRATALPASATIVLPANFLRLYTRSAAVLRMYLCRVTRADLRAFRSRTANHIRAVFCTVIAAPSILRYLCVCVCTYIHSFEHRHRKMCVSIYENVREYMYGMFVYICMYTCIRMYKHIYPLSAAKHRLGTVTHNCIHTYAHTSIHTHFLRRSIALAQACVEEKNKHGKSVFFVVEN